MGPLGGRDCGRRCHHIKFSYFNIRIKLIFWQKKRKEGNVLFNVALNTRYLRLYDKGPFR